MDLSAIFGSSRTKLASFIDKLLAGRTQRRAIGRKMDERRSVDDAAALIRTLDLKRYADFRGL